MRIDKNKSAIIATCVSCLQNHSKKILEIAESEDFYLIGSFTSGYLKGKDKRLYSDIDLLFLNENYQENLNKIKKVKDFIQTIIAANLQSIESVVKIGIRVRNTKELTCFVARMYSWFYPFKSLALSFNNLSVGKYIDTKVLLKILTEPRIIANNVAETLWQIAYLINNAYYTQDNGNQWYFLNKYSKQLWLVLMLSKMQHAITMGTVRDIDTLDCFINKILEEDSKISNESLKKLVDEISHTLMRQDIIDGFRNLKYYDPLLYSGFHFVPKNEFNILAFIFNILDMLQKSLQIKTYDKNMELAYNIRCQINEFFLLDRELRHYA
ncbi:hypothetical protein M1316_02755 [Candidatus Parvarchaeota archaeon]|nr:hypothetical protein [Candidatus Parvarchaeota archaeon]